MALSSSDSEDDYYCNAALKLKKLKNKFQDDNINTSNLLNDSQDNIPVPKSPIVIADKVDTQTPIKEPDLCEDSSILDEILAKNSKSRVTRSRAKKDATVAVTSTVPTTAVTSNTTCATTTTTRRGKGRGRGRKSTGCTTSTPSPRSRSRRGRQNRLPPSWLHDNYDIPTFSVGNTHEYPDMSDNQALFSNKPKDKDIVIIDADANDSIEENEELSVKVYWQSSEFFKFTLRKFQKLTQIFDYFEKKENVSHNNLLFTYNERILKPEDTPDSIDYNVVKYIDGGIVNENVSKLAVTSKDANIKNGIKLKFQCQLVKKPFETVVSRDEKLAIVMMKYAEHIEQPLNKLKFQFDGDCISGKLTATDLELEGGECIDVIVLS